MVGHVPEWSVLMIVLLSIVPVFATTVCSSWPTAHASAELLSMLNGEPPYFFRYWETNSLLPVVGTAGVQSLQLKMPLTFFLPTLLGNSVGELAPLAKNRNFGL